MKIKVSTIGFLALLGFVCLELGVIYKVQEDLLAFWIIIAPMIVISLVGVGISWVLTRATASRHESIKTLPLVKRTRGLTSKFVVSVAKEDYAYIRRS